MSEIEQWFSSLSVAELAGLGAGVAVAAILFIVLCCYCCLRRRVKPDEADLAMAASYRQNNPRFAQVGRQASAGTFLRNVGAKPSAGIASQFGKRKKKAPSPSALEEGEGVDTSSIKPTQAQGGPQFSDNVMKNLQQKQAGKAPPKKVTASAKKRPGDDLLTAEARQRISMARSANLKPILPAPNPAPNAKALRMMGITEQEASKRYDESVNKRMQRLAAGAGGGIYAPGFKTAEFVTGGTAFKQRLESRRKRKEEAARQRELKAKQKQEAAKDLSAPVKPPAPTPKKKPKPKGINAFLAEQEAAKQQAEEDEDDEEKAESEHIENDL